DPDAPARDADRDRDDGHAAARLPLLGPDAGEPRAALDPLGRDGQPRQLGGAGRPLGLGAGRRLGPDRVTHRLPGAAPARQRGVRHPRLLELPALDLTIDTQGGTRMVIAALSWPAAVVAATSIAAVGLVLAVSAWQLFAVGQEGGLGRDDAADLRAELAELRGRLDRPRSG